MAVCIVAHPAVMDGWMAGRVGRPRWLYLTAAIASSESFVLSASRSLDREDARRPSFICFNAANQKFIYNIIFPPGFALVRLGPDEVLTLLGWRMKKNAWLYSELKFPWANVCEKGEESGKDGGLREQDQQHRCSTRICFGWTKRGGLKALLYDNQFFFSLADVVRSLRYGWRHADGSGMCSSWMDVLRFLMLFSRSWMLEGSVEPADTFYEMLCLIRIISV